jgi:hypothetical protein
MWHPSWWSWSKNDETPADAGVLGEAGVRIYVTARLATPPALLGNGVVHTAVLDVDARRHFGHCLPDQ